MTRACCPPIATRVPCVLALALLMLGATPLAAQNGVVNGDFATDLSSWRQLGGGAAHDALDAASDPGSGSARLSTGTIGNGGLQRILEQCVALVPGTTYEVSARVFVPSAQTAPSGGAVSISLIRGDACSGVSPASFTTPVTSALDTWTTTSTFVTADDEVTSASVALLVHDSATVAQIAHFDAIVIQPVDGAAGVLVLSSATYSVGEGDGFVAVEIQRTGGSAGWTQAQLRTRPGSATAGDDYASGVLYASWADGSTAPYTAQIPITADVLDEGDEGFEVYLWMPENGASLGTPKEAVVTIVDDDAASPGEVRFSAAEWSAGEGEPEIEITVERVGGTSGSVKVGWATLPGTATAGDDYQQSDGTLGWDDGEAGPRTLAVQLFDDGDLEGDETFGVEITGVDGATIGSPAAATVTLLEDDGELGTVRWAAATFRGSEAEAVAEVTVTREDGADGDVTIDWHLVAETAAEGVDYLLDAGTLAWRDGEGGAQVIPLALIDDSEVEGDETFRVVLSNPGGGVTLGSPAEAVVTIDDDEWDPGVFAFSATIFAAGEESGVGTVTVERSGGSDGAATVRVVLSTGTATMGVDFIDASGTLSWSAGEDGAKSLDVPLIDDGEGEIDESLGLQLSNPTGGATIGDLATATLTIVDDDVQPGAVEFAAASYSEVEGGVVEVVVLRTGGDDRPVQVDYRVVHGSTAIGDFSLSISRLGWAHGDASPRTIPVTLHDDAVYEGDETFRIELYDPTNGLTLGAVPLTTLEIVDNEVPVPGQLALAAEIVAANEPDGTVTLAVTRSGGSDTAVAVDFATTDGTATAGADYTATSGTLAWGHGDAAAKTIVVPLLDDALFEATETFTVTLANPQGAALGAVTETTVALASDDAAERGTLRLDATSYEVGEDDGELEVTVERVGGTDGAVDVWLAVTSGTATDDDYTHHGVSLSWPDGDGDPRTVLVPIVDDALIEGDETFAVQLMTPGGGASLGTPASAPVTLIDDDRQVEIAVADCQAEEGGDCDLLVSLDAPSDLTVRVVYATADGTAVAGADYQATSGTLVFLPGETEQIVSVPTFPDALEEGDESFTLALSLPVNGILADGEASGTIRRSSIFGDGFESGSTAAWSGATPAPLVELARVASRDAIELPVPLGALAAGRPATILAAVGAIESFRIRLERRPDGAVLGTLELPGGSRHAFAVDRDATALVLHLRRAWGPAAGDGEVLVVVGRDLVAWADHLGDGDGDLRLVAEGLTPTPAGVAH